MNTTCNVKRLLLAVSFLSIVLVIISGCHKLETKLMVAGKEATHQEMLLTGTGNDMPIGIYIAPPFNFTSDQQYQYIRDANVDFIQDISGWIAPVDKLTMLDMAYSHGLKMVVADDRINGTNADITALVSSYVNHPATAGYYVKDEPTVAQLQDAANRYQKLLTLDNNHDPHVNLFPSYATGALGSINYEQDYIEAWIQKVGAANLRYLSIDNYPFLSNGTFREVPYFNDLNVIRRVGLKYHIKTSAYLQSIGSSIGLRRPNANELRYSAYTNLAYGIKKPVWFTYWTPTGGSETYTNAIIDAAGNKTDLYTPFQALNLEIKQLGKTLVSLDAIAVYHTGTTIPTGTVRPPANFIWQPQNAASTMIISQLTDPVSGKEYIMVVNKSFTSSNTFSFTVASTVANVKVVSKVTSLEEATNFAIGTHTLSDTFLPGEGKLYSLEKASVSTIVSTLAGSGIAGFNNGQGTVAQFNFATNTGMATDASGNIYVADVNNHCIRKITPAGLVSTLAGNPGVAGKTDGLGTNALFDHPSAVTVDANNNVYVADTWNWAVRKITPAGSVTTIITWVLPFPQGITIDKNTGKLYVVSALPSVSQNKLYEVSAAGVMTTRTLSVPVISGGITMDSQGNLVIADNGSSTVYKVNPATWAVTPVAGLDGQTGQTDGVGSSARFEHPWGITIDASDNIYVAGCGHLFDAPTIADSASSIRRIEAGTNKVTTIAGLSQGYVDGAGNLARFTVPTGIGMGTNGTIYVLDRFNQRIRKLALQ
jgi:sugar lactone lactonase YvrE